MRAGVIIRVTPLGSSQQVDLSSTHSVAFEDGTYFIQERVIQLRTVQLSVLPEVVKHLLDGIRRRGPGLLGSALHLLSKLL